MGIATPGNRGLEALVENDWAIAYVRDVLSSKINPPRWSRLIASATFVFRGRKLTMAA